MKKVIISAAIILSAGISSTSGSKQSPVKIEANYKAVVTGKQNDVGTAD